MKAIEKIKAQKAVDKIQSGDFDEGDVEMLFLRLRAYAGEHKIFREAADFVAHNDARDRGLTNSVLDAFFLGIRFVNDYVITKAPLDISKEFPSYIKKHLKYQIAGRSAESLKSAHNSSAQKLLSMIDNIIKEDSRTKTCVLKPGVSNSKLKIVQALLSYVGGAEVFTSEQLMADMFEVLEKNDIKFSKEAMVNNQTKILLSFGLLLHMTEFKLTDGLLAKCILGGDIKWDPNGPAPGSNIFGELSVFGECTVGAEGQGFTTCYSVFGTGLMASDVCAEVLFEVRQPQLPGLPDRRLNLERPLQMIDGMLFPI